MLTDDECSHAAAKYTTQMVSRMADVNADAAVVGFYTSTNNGQVLATGGFIEALVGAQLSGQGVGSGVKAQPAARAGLGARPQAQLASGEANKAAKGIALVYGASERPAHVPSQALTDGELGAMQTLRVRRRARSASRRTACRSRSSTRTARASSTLPGARSPLLLEERTSTDSQHRSCSLIEHKLVPTNILEEVPVTVHSSALLTAFLSTLTAPSPAGPSSPLSTPSFSSLSLPAPSASSHVQSAAVPAPLTQPLSHLLTALETHQAHLSTLSFQSRQLARERTRLEATHPAVAKRRQENEQRAREGLAPLPLTDDEVRAGLREPSRLETMCALAAVEGAAKSLAEATGTGVVRAFGAKAGAEGVGASA